MNLKKNVKRAFEFIFNRKPMIVTHANIAQINYGGILNNRKIIITGASKGIGLAIAKKCLDEQAFVTITGRSKEHLDDAKSLLGEHERLFTLQHDVNNIAEDDSIISQASQMMGGIDSLINNAGISIHNIDYLSCNEEQWDIQMNTNLKGAYFFTQAFAKALFANGTSSGKIIFIVSERGLYGDDVPYGLSKRALISFTEGLSKKLIRSGVRVNAIAPGVTATDMTGYSPKGNLYRRFAVGRRVLLSEEIAETAIFLLSDAANCISGQIIACNEANHLK